MTDKTEAYYKKKIELLEEQCKAYQELVGMYKSDVANLTKQVELSDKLIKKQDEYIEIAKTIDCLEEKKKECVLRFIDEVQKN